jgi:hypothetical protein
VRFCEKAERLRWQNLQRFRSRECEFLGNSHGIVAALLADMSGVNRYEDLHVWQLSVQLRDAIEPMTNSGKAAKDFKFRDQIRAAAAVEAAATVGPRRSPLGVCTDDGRVLWGSLHRDVSAHNGGNGLRLGPGLYSRAFSTACE